MIIEKGTFENKNFSNHPLASKEYINCMFNNIIFSGANLTNCIFVDCTFNMCNFSNTDIDHCGFQEVSFIGCKLLSLSFYKVRPFLFSVNFNDCMIMNCDFHGLKMPKTEFLRGRIIENYFTNTNLSSSKFSESDLNKTIFKNSNLSKTDFRNAINYSIDPRLNHIEGAIFSNPDVIGLLDYFDIKIE